MLELKNITKVYGDGENKVEALKGISLALRDNEFVSILGQSGCGKTTTLNIIGGLDRYTTGELLIDNVSTKEYKDKDWDRYRNHNVGFVFQSYNLIPHQTILSNVEMALTIGGVSKELRKDLAIDALIKVGLEKEMHKFPRQLSGGQMQRVAIARAIVNKPTILLADEPTGALDSKTSIQVLDILKELSKNCLIVMVTHNEELAKTYSTRIISLKDGEMINDTDPFIPTEEDKTNSIEKNELREKNYVTKKNKPKKVRMPFITALKLSLANLKSKLGRTLLTCFAGSIGIIGIALILSVSNGFNKYIDDVENSTLSRYPITLTKSTMDMTSLFISFMETNNDSKVSNNVELNKVTPKYVMVDLLRSIASAQGYNDLRSFKKYLDANRYKIEDNIDSISYNYDVELNIYNKTEYQKSGKVVRLNPFDLPDYYNEEEQKDSIYIYTPEFNSEYMETLMSNLVVWSEMYDDYNLLNEQYDVIAGSWPSSYNEVVLVLDENNQMSDFSVYSAGLAEDAREYIKQLFKYINKSKDDDSIEDPSETYKAKYIFDYDELMEHEYYCVPNSQYYIKSEIKNGVQTYVSVENDDTEIANLFDDNENIIALKISGIVRENPNSSTHSIEGAVGYTKNLINKIIEINNNSDPVKTQKENPEYCLVNMFKSSAFDTSGYKFDFIQSMARANKNSLGLTDGTIDQMDKDIMYEKMLSTYFGNVDEENPSSISIYPKSFEDKDAVMAFINEYNSGLTEEEDDKRITYNDYLSSIMGSVTTIVNSITYVLIAFVSISLIVSSIMIAIITYISVLERTKEIGILRAMGASKADVKNIFNAETFITGLVAGLIGILITIILNIPISLIIENLSGIKNMAILPPLGGAILIIISFLLSVFSGLIPSGYAAKCDPVVALRSE